MSDDSTKPYKDRNVWMRGLFMLIFMFFLGVAKFVTFVVVLVQFVQTVFTSDTNEKLLRFGDSLSQYQYQILLFLTYNSEQQPYPMGDWPEPNVKTAQTLKEPAEQAVETAEVSDLPSEKRDS